MIRIVVTISDFGAAANVGGDVERTSEIIHVPTNNIPSGLKLLLGDKQDRKWKTISLSLIEEES